MNRLKILSLVAVFAIAGCSGSKDAASQASAGTAAPAAATAGPASGALDGVKGRVPMYASNVTRPAATVVAGTYQFESADSPSAVYAWYKAHLPPDLSGTWTLPDPDAAPEWVYNAKISDGRVMITVQPPNASMSSAYATGTKAIVAVTDR